MDTIETFLSRLALLFEGKATVIEAGNVTARLICPDMVVIHLGDQSYLVERPDSVSSIPQSNGDILGEEFDPVSA